MPSNIFTFCKRILAFSTLAWLATGTASAAEKVLVNFNGSDGNGPYAGLISDAAGNLYGTTVGGGPYGFGTAFELERKAGGGWTGKLLHSFDDNGIDGVAPYTRLVFDSAGNLYGTTNNGGPDNVGTVFELIPTKSGPWKETILYSFENNEIDGTYPYGALIFDSAGNLYGTTAGGGLYFQGTVYELKSSQNGEWAETILHNFDFNGTDGLAPYAGVIFDGSDNLYGTTYGGGTFGDGTVFELTPQRSGEWDETILYNFNGQSAAGEAPYGTLIWDADGNLYGTTVLGGIYDAGTVFELTPQTGGNWTENALHAFEPSDWDGGNPFGGLIFDGSGNLYGTTNQGGEFNYGTVFELTRKANGTWAEKQLHTFQDNGTDGYSPYCNLVLDSSGNLYGVTYQGGKYNDGTLFEVTP